MQKRSRRRTTGHAQKLTENDVRTLRAGYRPGDNVNTLAARYRTTRGTIVEALNRLTWKHLEPLPGEYDPPPGIRGTRRVEQQPRTSATQQEKRQQPPATPTANTRATAAREPAGKQAKPIDEKTVRAIRRAYRPGVRLRQLEERFGRTGGTIISIANRASYEEYATGENEYEPPASIRGTRRREPPPAQVLQERPTMPIYRTNTKHLLPRAIQVIREAIDDGEPIQRVARSFGLTPEALAHMKPRSR